MKTACLYLSLLVAIVSAVQYDYCKQHAPAGAVNGCSLPPLVHFNYEYQFTPSCNKHDICYHCGHHYGITRSDCDHKFLHNMLATCSRKRLLNCQHSADAFFGAVRTAGGLFYRTEVPHYCTESWVHNCLT
ncbi:conodipine-P3-like [Saccostrea cucullata]|uniref:conodipine-P3-like n=1 Tax=Saccostrea cuccullata TaxID=36930 RepID=UPI002ED17FFE